MNRTARARPLIALALLAGCGGDSAAPDRATPAPGPGAAQSTPDAPSLPEGRGHILARVLRPVLVHDKPGGEPIARLRRTTPFGRPRTLAVVETREDGAWLGVHSPVLGNGRTGWIAGDERKLRLSRTRISLHVDLTRKQVAYRRGDRVVRRFPIAIGAAGTETPPGRFQVTDKLSGGRFAGAAYGCCIIALSARQPNLPDDWPGGDRIAIHGTTVPQTIGTASSTGCLRATDAHMRILMRDVPVGAPVFIRG